MVFTCSSGIFCSEHHFLISESISFFFRAILESQSDVFLNVFVIRAILECQSNVFYVFVVGYIKVSWYQSPAKSSTMRNHDAPNSEISQLFVSVLVSYHIPMGVMPIHLFLEVVVGFGHLVPIVRIPIVRGLVPLAE